MPLIPLGPVSSPRVDNDRTTVNTVTWTLSLPGPNAPARTSALIAKKVFSMNYSAFFLIGKENHLEGSSKSEAIHSDIVLPDVVTIRELSRISSLLLRLRVPFYRHSPFDIRDHYHHGREKPERLHDANDDECVCADGMGEQTDEPGDIAYGQTPEKGILRPFEYFQRNSQDG